MSWADVSRMHFREKMLWACALRRTIFDYVLYKGIGKHKLRWQQAYRFLFIDDEEGELCLTFNQICGLFGWEPDYLRRKIKELDRGHIKKLEAMKFKECFDEDTADVFVQAAHWESGQTVPIFIPYNYSKAYREQMRLRGIQRTPPQRPKSIVPVARWNLAFA